MPARRLPDSPPVSVPRFAVIGHYVPEPGTRFVRHVAVLRADGDLHYGRANTLVWHMGPPLIAGPESSATAQPDKTTCEPHLVVGHY